MLHKCKFRARFRGAFLKSYAKSNFKCNFRKLCVHFKNYMQNYQIWRACLKVAITQSLKVACKKLKRKIENYSFKALKFACNIGLLTLRKGHMIKYFPKI